MNSNGKFCFHFYQFSSESLSESATFVLVRIWIKLYLWAASANFLWYSSLAKISSACLLIASLIADFFDSAFAIFLDSSLAAFNSATCLASSAASSASLIAIYLCLFSSSSCLILARTSSSVLVLISSAFLENSRFIFYSTSYVTFFFICSTSFGSARWTLSSSMVSFFLSSFFSSFFSSFLSSFLASS